MFYGYINQLFRHYDVKPPSRQAMDGVQAALFMTRWTRGFDRLGSLPLTEYYSYSWLVYMVNNNRYLIWGYRDY
jgi:hypothetical protein